MVELQLDGSENIHNVTVVPENADRFPGRKVGDTVSVRVVRTFLANYPRRWLGSLRDTGDISQEEFLELHAGLFAIEARWMVDHPGSTLEEAQVAVADALYSGSLEK